MPTCHKGWSFEVVVCIRVAVTIFLLLDIIKFNINLRIVSFVWQLKMMKIIQIDSLTRLISNLGCMLMLTSVIYYSIANVHLHYAYFQFFVPTYTIFDNSVNILLPGSPYLFN